MAQQTWTGSDQAKDVLLNRVQENDTELYLTKAEVEEARKTESTLEDKIDAMDTDIDANTAKDTNVTTNLSEGTSTETTVDVNSSDGTNATLAAASTLRAGLFTKSGFDTLQALIAASGVKISSDDTTLGFLDGKILPGSGLSRTVNSPGGDESMTLDIDMVTNLRLQTNKGADVASASALTLGTDGNYFDITGTTNVTSITTTGNVGTVVKLHIDTGVTFVHHATDLVLPDGVNLVATAGSELEFTEYASGDFRLTGYLNIGNRSLLTVIDASGASIIAFTDFIDIAYKSYTMKSEGFFSSVGASNMTFQVGTGVTPTWETGNDYAFENVNVDSGSAVNSSISTSSASIIIGGIPQSANANSNKLDLTITNPSAAYASNVHGHLNTFRETGVVTGLSSIIDGYFNSTTAVTAMRLNMGGETLVGLFYLYGNV